MSEMPRPRVLIALHLAILQEMVRTQLEREGYEVTLAYHSDEVMAELEAVQSGARTLDLLILSEEIPGEAGVSMLDAQACLGVTTRTIFLHCKDTDLFLPYPQLAAVLRPPFHVPAICEMTHKHVPTAQGSGFDGKRVLVVEDEGELAQSLMYALGSAGYLCDTATSGPEAINKAGWLLPDVVLLDLNLPGLDGTDVCLRLRNDARMDKTKIIMMTARSSPYDKFLGSEVGATDYMTKPFSISTLLEKVRSAVE